MQEYELKYGCNPNQKPARIYTVSYTHLDVYNRQITCTDRTPQGGKGAACA